MAQFITLFFEILLDFMVSPAIFPFLGLMFAAFAFLMFLKVLKR